MRRSLEDRFFDRVIPEPNSGCWLWEGSQIRGGYGVISLGGRDGANISAHRASMIIHGHVLPHGSIVLHKCDNPPCVNPDHLTIGTQSDNMRDMVAKGREYSRDLRSLRMKGKAQNRIAKIGSDHWNFGNRQSTCKHGHEMTSENIIIGSDGARRCKLCNRASALARYHRTKKETK